MAAGYVFGSLCMALLSSLIWISHGGSLLSTLVVYTLVGQVGMVMMISIGMFRTDR